MQNLLGVIIEFDKDILSIIKHIKHIKNKKSDQVAIKNVNPSILQIGA